MVVRSLSGPVHACRAIHGFRMTDLSLPPARYAPAIEFPPLQLRAWSRTASPGQRPRWPPPRHPGLSTRVADLRRHARGPVDGSAHSHWLYALDLFNGGFYWEAHEAWEGFWHALGRTTPEARFVQGLIHVAAAAVKIREGKPAGVHSHTRRACDLLGDRGEAKPFGKEPRTADTLGLSRESIVRLLGELEIHRAECWQTSKCPVVRVVVTSLRMST
jgi:predicted metal-dependent hydrolase